MNLNFILSFKFIIQLKETESKYDYMFCAPIHNIQKNYNIQSFICPIIIYKKQQKIYHKIGLVIVSFILWL